MRGFLSVYKREVKSYFATPVAYVFLFFFLVFCTLLTFQQGFFDARQASLRAFFVNLPVLFLFLVPAISMRLWAEERRNNSVELLFTLPITTPQAVLGKFLAAWSVLAIALGLTLPIVITVAFLGDPDWGPIVTGYFGSLLMAGAYLAIGSFFSSISRNQVIAFILAVVACGVFYAAGSPNALSFVAGMAGRSWIAVNVSALVAAFFLLLVWGWFSEGLPPVARHPLAIVAALAFFVIVFDLLTLGLLPAWGRGLAGLMARALPEAMEALSFQSRFESIQRGILELRDLAFFVLLGAGWLWANMMVLEERKAA